MSIMDIKISFLPMDSKSITFLCLVSSLMLSKSLECCKKKNSSEENSSSSETYEKRKICSTRFHNLGKLTLQMNLQISLHAQGPMPKKSTRDVFLEHLNSET